MQKPWGGVLLMGLLSLFSYRTLDHQQWDGTTHNGLGPPHQSLILKSALRICGQMDIMKAFSLSCVTLVHVKLT